MVMNSSDHNSDNVMMFVITGGDYDLITVVKMTMMLSVVLM